MCSMPTDQALEPQATEHWSVEGTLYPVQYSTVFPPDTESRKSPTGRPGI